MYSYYVTSISYNEQKRNRMEHKYLFTTYAIIINLGFNSPSYFNTERTLTFIQLYHTI